MRFRAIAGGTSGMNVRARPSATTSRPSGLEPERVHADPVDAGLTGDRQRGDRHPELERCALLGRELLDRLIAAGVGQPVADRAVGGRLGRLGQLVPGGDRLARDDRRDVDVGPRLQGGVRDQPGERDRALAWDLGGSHGGERDRERGLVLIGCRRPDARHRGAGRQADHQRGQQQAGRDGDPTERTGRQSGAGHSRDAIRAYAANRDGTQPHPALSLRSGAAWPPPRVVSRVRGAPADQRRPGARCRRAGPAGVGHRRAGPALRRCRGRDRARRRPGPGRDARPAAQRPRLHHLRPPRGHREAARGLGRLHLGHRPRLRHHRLPAWGMGRRDHDLPVRGVRRRQPQARGAVRRLAGRRPCPTRLHRELDGVLAARAAVRGPLRRNGRPGQQGAADPGPP